MSVLSSTPSWSCENEASIWCKLYLPQTNDSFYYIIPVSILVLFPPLQSLRRPFDIFCYLHPEWLKCAIRYVCRSRFVSATLMYSESLEWSPMNWGERKRWQRGQRCELSSPPSLLSDIIKDGRGYHVCLWASQFIHSVSVFTSCVASPADTFGDPTRRTCSVSVYICEFPILPWAALIKHHHNHLHQKGESLCLTEYCIAFRWLFADIFSPCFHSK